MINIIGKRSNTFQIADTKSSTESEVVGASDYIPWTVRTTKILEHQGYKVDIDIFYQDNESAIKMQKNGRRLAGDKSRHINIRYFFIKDILERQNIEMKHCPTERMIADFLTKPLQGAEFKRLRDIIMGVVPFPIKERVEIHKNERFDVDHQKAIRQGDDITKARSYAGVLRGNKIDKPNGEGCER